MNTLQQIEFDILKELDNICKTNGIKYYLAYGTALGAVRHKGFIPWDDDIDVVMLRDDYDKFCKLAPEEIPDDLFFQTVYSNIEYPFADKKSFINFLILNSSSTIKIQLLILSFILSY